MVGKWQEAQNHETEIGADCLTIKSSLFKPLKFRSPKTRKFRPSKIERFNSKTKPKSRISENSVKPQEGKGKSPKALPTAWTNVSSQLNPDRDKIFNFHIKNLVSILLLRLGFFSDRQQIKSYFPWLDLILSALSTLTVTKSFDF